MHCSKAELQAVMQLKFGGGDGATTLSVASALASNIGGFLAAMHRRLWSMRGTSDCVQVFAARPSCVLRTCHSGDCKYASLPGYPLIVRSVCSVSPAVLAGRQLLSFSGSFPGSSQQQQTGFSIKLGKLPCKPQCRQSHAAVMQKAESDVRQESLAGGRWCRLPDALSGFMQQDPSSNLSCIVPEDVPPSLYNVSLAVNETDSGSASLYGEKFFQ